MSERVITATLAVMLISFLLGIYAVASLRDELADYREASCSVPQTGAVFGYRDEQGALHCSQRKGKFHVDFS